MTTMMMMMNTDGNNEYNNAGAAQFLAHLTPKERTLISNRQTSGTRANSLEKKGHQMHWQWDSGNDDAVVCSKKKRGLFQQKQTQEQEEETTEWIDEVWMNLAKQVAQGNFQEHMTKLDAMVWIRHGIKILERMNKEETVARKALILENVTLLHSFAWLMRHPVPVSVMLDDDLRYFERLGKIFQTGATIAPEPFSQIGVALVDGLVKCATEDKPQCKPKKVFQKLESTGWLKLYLVWAADKTTTICKDKVKTLDLLKNCTSFLMDSFHVGTPCGNELREIVKRDHGSFKSCPVVLSSYADLIQISESAECAYKYCDTVASWEKMSHCGKCLKVYYCCRECQIAAWNEHKPNCCAPIDNFQSGLEFVHHAMQCLDLC